MKRIAAPMIGGRAAPADHCLWGASFTRTAISLSPLRFPWTTAR